MSSLLQLFTRSGAFFMFAALEILCFYLIVNFNSAQQEIAAESWTLYSGKVMQRVNKLQDFISLREQNQRLQEENAELRSLLPNAVHTERINIDSVIQQSDSIRQRYTFVSADIINKSPLSANITYVINRGYIHGIEKHQGVINDRGVIGIVIAVSARHARVMSLLHRDMRLSAGLRGKNFFGSLAWQGGDARYATLTSIPEYAAVAPGDTIETTGFSNIFPTGVPVGKVTDISTPPGGNTYTLQVELFNEFFGLKHAYVVRNLLKGDLELLDVEE